MASLKDVTNQAFQDSSLVKRPSLRDYPKTPPLNLEKRAGRLASASPVLAELPELPPLDSFQSPLFKKEEDNPEILFSPLPERSPPGDSQTALDDDVQAGDQTQESNRAVSLLGYTEVCARIAEFIECAVPEGLQDSFEAAMHRVLAKLPSAIHALELNNDIYYFRDYHGSLQNARVEWYENDVCHAVSSVWVVECLLPLLDVLCQKQDAEGIDLIALCDTLASLRGLAVAMCEDVLLANSMIDDCWPRFELLMAAEQSEVAYQAFRTAKLVIYNAVTSERLLQVGNNFATELTGNADIDDRLYRYRLDILELLVNKVENLSSAVPDEITVYLMRFAHQLEQAKAQEDQLVLLRQIQDILQSIKGILAKATPTSPVLMRGRYYPTLAGYPTIGDHCTRPLPEENFEIPDIPVEPQSSLPESSTTLREFERYYPVMNGRRDDCDIDSALFRASSVNSREAVTLPAPKPRVISATQSVASSATKVATWFHSLRAFQSMRGLTHHSGGSLTAQSKKKRFVAKLRRIFRPFTKESSTPDLPEIDTTLDIDIPNWKFQSWRPGDSSLS